MNELNHLIDEFSRSSEEFGFHDAFYDHGVLAEQVKVEREKYKKELTEAVDALRAEIERLKAENEKLRAEREPYFLAEPILDKITEMVESAKQRGALVTASDIAMLVMGDVNKKRSEK